MDDGLDVVGSTAITGGADLHRRQDACLHVDLIGQGYLLTKIGSVSVRGGEVRREVNRPVIWQLTICGAFCHRHDDGEVLGKYPPQALVLVALDRRCPHLVFVLTAL